MDLYSAPAPLGAIITFLTAWLCSMTILVGFVLPAIVFGLRYRILRVRELWYFGVPPALLLFVWELTCAPQPANLFYALALTITMQALCTYVMVFVAPEPVNESPGARRASAVSSWLVWLPTIVPMALMLFAPCVEGK